MACLFITGSFAILMTNLNDVLYPLWIYMIPIRFSIPMNFNFLAGMFFYVQPMLSHYMFDADSIDAKASIIQIFIRGRSN
jgi:hypothetical protein